MKIRTLISLLLLVSSVGLAQTNVNGNFIYKGLSRDYIIHLPPSPGTNPPLVINLHGYGQTAALHQLYSAFDNVADTANIIVVYPNAVNNVWDTIFQNSAIDDVGFISTLIDTLIKDYGIDTNRIYSTGLSMGGFMTYRLGCELGERIAAIASVAGPVTDSLLSLCDNAPLFSVLHIHGTTDSTIPYNGQGLYPSVDSTIQYFVQKNACPATPIISQLPDVDNTDSSTVTRSYYGPCYNSHEVLLYTVNNGGHTWPGTFPFPPLGNTNQDMSASAEIWNFFRKHLLDTSTTTPDPLAAATSSNPATEGICNGDATVNASGGIGTYTYLWSDSTAQTTAMATGLCAGDYSVFITDGSGDTLTVFASVVEVTGIENDKKIQNIDLVLYPNPTSGTMFIVINKAKGPYELSIIDILGQVVFGQTIYPMEEAYIRESLDLSSLEKGIYFIKLINGTELLSGKVVVE